MTVRTLAPALQQLQVRLVPRLPPLDVDRLVTGDKIFATSMKRISMLFCNIELKIYIPDGLRGESHDRTWAQGVREGYPLEKQFYDPPPKEIPSFIK